MRQGYARYGDVVKYATLPAGDILSMVHMMPAELHLPNVPRKITIDRIQYHTAGSITATNMAVSGNISTGGLTVSGAIKALAITTTAD